jgi:hypothetical protein
MGPYVYSGYTYKISRWAHTLIADMYIKSVGPYVTSEYIYTMGGWAHVLLANTYITLVNGPIRY